MPINNKKGASVQGSKPAPKTNSAAEEAAISVQKRPESAAKRPESAAKRPESAAKAGEKMESWLELNLQQAVNRSLSEEDDSLTKISSSKWPLIVDVNERAQTFYHHRDVNWLNCMDPETMKPDRVRRLIIGAIRYGKPLVVELMNMDKLLLESLKTTCDMLDKDLFHHLTRRTLLDDAKNYMYLAKPDVDGKEYEANNFSPIIMAGFRVIYTTSNANPSEEILRISVPVRVV